MSINFGFEASVKNGRSSRAAGRLEQFEGTNETIIPLPPPDLFHLGVNFRPFLTTYEKVDIFSFTQRLILLALYFIRIWITWWKEIFQRT